MTISSGETPDLAHIDRFNSEPSALNTQIEINDLSRLPQLEAQLQVYRDRNQVFASQNLTQLQDVRDVGYRADRHVSVFEETILSVVLALASKEGRDVNCDPIVLSTVVSEVMDVTGLDVSFCATVPFKYNHEGAYEPDLNDLFEKVIHGESTFEDIAFLEAYTTIQKLVKTVTQGNTSPTNLPVMNFPTE